ncbi:YfhD family protein [Evansella tamaricis]|uniref:YfhD family protein n=1 Tax=Evansella tamaricis TaxID=2069301 RepID=A0ABS6JI57_9BACI|nr:YfhD family protein [Evansella tamaricis]MBU9712145.1 YfhD family protein [Evansella tamaricis]
MGRAHKQKARDKNKQKLPQTPQKDIAADDQDLELAKEVDDLYELKARPGYSPTEVRRKK